MFKCRTFFFWTNILLANVTGSAQYMLFAVVGPRHGWKFSTTTGGTGGSIRQLSLGQRIGPQRYGLLCPTMFEIRTIREQEWFFLTIPEALDTVATRRISLLTTDVKTLKLVGISRGYDGGGSKESQIWPKMLVKAV